MRVLDVLLVSAAVVRLEQTAELDVSAEGLVSGGEIAASALEFEEAMGMHVDICNAASFNPSCPMFHKNLVFQVSASNVPERGWEWMRGMRNMYTTVRIKDPPYGDISGDVSKSYMVGEKMRTQEIKTLEPQWRETFVVPMACVNQHDAGRTFVEFNIKDTAVGITRPWSKRLAQVKLLLTDFADVAEGQDRLFDRDGVQVSIRHAWCDPATPIHTCLMENPAARFLANTPVLQHVGLDCGQGCHHALMRVARPRVARAKELADTAINSYHEMERSERQQEHHDRQQRHHDRRGSRADWKGDQEREDHHQRQEDHHRRQEDYYRRREREMARRMERTWDQMKAELPGMDQTLQQSCGSRMPLLGLEQQQWYLSWDFSRHQAETMRRELGSILSSIDSSYHCLRRLWFQGQYSEVRDHYCSFA